MINDGIDMTEEHIKEMISTAYVEAIAADAATIGIPAEVTFYDRLGITEEEVEQMKGELV